MKTRGPGLNAAGVELVGIDIAVTATAVLSVALLVVVTAAMLLLSFRLPSIAQHQRRPEEETQRARVKQDKPLHHDGIN